MAIINSDGSIEATPDQSIESIEEVESEPTTEDLMTWDAGGDTGGDDSPVSTSDYGDSSDYTYTDPDQELRNVSGASDGATGSEVLASGGDPVAAAISVTGTGKTASSGTVKRVIESDATDSPGDIAAKVAGESDPNPGHTPTDTFTGKNANESDPLGVSNYGLAVVGAVVAAILWVMS